MFSKSPWMLLFTKEMLFHLEQDVNIAISDPRNELTTSELGLSNELLSHQFKTSN